MYFDIIFYNLVVTRSKRMKKRRKDRHTNEKMLLIMISFCVFSFLPPWKSYGNLKIRVYNQHWTWTKWKLKMVVWLVHLVSLPFGL